MSPSYFGLVFDFLAISQRCFSVISVGDVSAMSYSGDISVISRSCLCRFLVMSRFCCCSVSVLFW